MTHRVLALPLVAALLVGLCACTSTSSGTPATTGTAPPASTGSATTAPSTPPATASTTPGKPPLGAVDPCKLITQKQVSRNGLLPARRAVAAGGHACRWTRPDDGAKIDGYEIQIVIYNDAGLDQLHTAGGTVSAYSVGKYPGKLFVFTADNLCDVSIGTTKTSRVDVNVVSGISLSQGCKLVKEVAPIVVANFPAGS